MQENIKDKGKYSFLRPAGIETFAYIFSVSALQWLHGTTTDDDGREIGNFTLFADLLARMAIAEGTAKGFHRPLKGHAQQYGHNGDTCIDPLHPLTSMGAAGTAVLFF